MNSNYFVVEAKESKRESRRF